MLVRELGRVDHQQSDVRHLPRSLRACSERRGEETTRNTADQRSPVHH
jgi:hypothetical protein